jgi:hypothetical protein
MANFVRRIQNYTNHYKPGPVNLNADALSGNPVMITSLQDNTSAKLEDNFVRFSFSIFGLILHFLYFVTFVRPVRIDSQDKNHKKTDRIGYLGTYNN